MTIDAVRVMRETSIARVEYHPTVDSTNDRAAQCAAQGAIDLPLLVVADQQTAGRGRGGNRWWSSAGSLAFSLLVDAATVAADESRSPLVALAAAVAVVDARRPAVADASGRNPLAERRVRPHCQLQCGVGRISVCRERVGTSGLHEFCRPVRTAEADRKLAGILVEVLPDRRHVIGIGLNVNNTLADAPAELRRHGRHAPRSLGPSSTIEPAC